jgi:hypothetical protein
MTLAARFGFEEHYLTDSKFAMREVQMPHELMWR